MPNALAIVIARIRNRHVTQRRKHGVESQARDHPRFNAYLRGFASYINMVHPEEGEELLRQIDELLGTEAEGQEEGS